jgi:hypothetical protein
VAWRTLCNEFGVEYARLAVEMIGVPARQTLSRHLGGDDLERAVGRLEELEVATAEPTDPIAGARELLAAIASPRWRRVYLTHLSRDCNSPAAVERALAGVRATLTACEFAIVAPGEGTPFYDL